MSPRFLASYLIAALAVVATFGGRPAAAQQTDRIAAVVNDEILSVSDVEARVKMAITLSHLPDNVDTRRRVVPQVLRKLIDERLQAQEAKRLKITVSKAEIDEGVGNVERQNNMPKGTMLANLSKEGIDPELVRQQIGSDLLWYRLASGMLQPTIHVGEEEVNDRLETLKARRGKPEFLVAEIFLPVDNLTHEEQIRSLGERLLDQLQQGAPFPMLAGQFSQSATAANGGSMGWVSEGMIDDELLDQLKQIEPGHITPLFRSADGFRILGLVDRRIAGTELQATEPSVVLASMLLPVPVKGPPKEALVARAVQISRGSASCDDFEAKGRQVGATVLERTPMAKVSGLPAVLQRVVTPLPVGGVSPPFDTPDALQVVMVCSRTNTAVAELPSRDQIRRILESERLEMMTQRFLRNLRRAAFVDIRM